MTEPTQRRWLALPMLVLLAGCAQEPAVVRFATFNASLNRERAGQLVADLERGDDAQIRNVAEIIQRVRPDVLLINEFDYSEDNRAPQLFQEKYLSVGQNGAQPIEYAHRVYLPVNTGLPSGFDLDNDGKVVTEPGTRGYGNDCFGFGQFPGQYGMLLLSRYPFHSERFVRTFQNLKWKDMPGALLPTKPDGTAWYDQKELDVLRLSSKSHWDVALQINERVVHVLASHPTPPAFDGPEDRNGKRNHDEIRLWADYIRDDVGYVSDDDGRTSNILVDVPKHGLVPWLYRSFMLLGDLNADPNDGASIRGAIQQLLDHPRVNSQFVPRSEGAVEASQLQGGINKVHKSDPQFDTSDFSDGENGAGNLRCDYVLPSNDLKVLGGGVFWPATNDPLHRLVTMDPLPASSDHRLVWIDVEVK